MRSLSLTYPHDERTAEPSKLPAWAIWKLANNARSQLCLHPKQLRINLSTLARSRAVEINDVAFSVAWEMDGPVADENGSPVLGETEVLDGTRQATIRLNADLIGERSDLALSTALHELGHVVFDVPAWLACAGEDDNAPDNRPPLRFLRLDRPETKADTPNWAEWRANEFMGGFLAPRGLLVTAVAKSCRTLRLAMVEAAEPHAPAQILVDRFSRRFDDLVESLADGFGLSPSFMATRLIKYKMLAGGQ